MTSYIKPKVTHIITGLAVGGAERALHTLLTGGLQGPFDNRVISLTDEGHYGPLLREAGISVTCLGMASGRPSLTAVWRLRQALRANPPDILQGWMYHGNLAASLARKLTPGLVKLVWNIRTSLDYYPELSLSRRGIIRLGRFCSRGSQVILFNSTRAMKQHSQFGYIANQIFTIPNGFDTGIWAPSAHLKNKLREDLGLNGSTLIIGFVGRDDPQKDPQNFFSALTNVLPTIPNAKAIVVGRGLQDAAPHSLPLKQIIFLGQRDKISKIMPAFDILCLSSRVEGFPNVIGEAMACGVPCVTTNVGDAAEIVADTGWVVPPRDSDALSKALREALSVTQEERNARGRAARFKIVNDYSLLATLDQYIKLYYDLTGVR